MEMISGLPADMVVAACAIGLGVLYCFFGYRIFKLVLGISGFVIGAAAGYQASLALFPQRPTLALILAAAAGLVMAVLCIFVYLIGIFSLGASFGAAVGLAITGFGGKMMQPILIVILSVVGGALALLLQKHIIILVTSLAGSSFIVTGTWKIARGVDPSTLTEDPESLGRELYVIMGCWALLTLLGIVVQYKVTGKKQKLLGAGDKKK